MRDNERDFIELHLSNDLMFERFDELNILKEKINVLLYEAYHELIEIKELTEVTRTDDTEQDYQLMAEVFDKNGEVFGYLDIFFLKLRNGGLMVTDVNFDRT